jgi:hypothetical protein
MKSIVMGAALLALASSLAGCATNPTTGDYTVGGADIGFGPTQVAVADADVKAFVKALPAVCQRAALGQAILAADLAVIQANSHLPAKTVANISNATNKIVTICAGLAANIPPSN